MPPLQASTLAAQHTQDMYGTPHDSGALTARNSQAWASSNLARPWLHAANCSCAQQSCQQAARAQQALHHGMQASILVPLIASRSCRVLWLQVWPWGQLQYMHAHGLMQPSAQSTNSTQCNTRHHSQHCNMHSPHYTNPCTPHGAGKPAFGAAPADKASQPHFQPHTSPCKV
jgi:hypothetical protein